MVFQSKVDNWLLVLVLTAPVLTVLACLRTLTTGGDAGAWLALLPLLLLGFALPLWMLRSTDYRVEGDTCHVRCGPFRWKLPLSSIESVRETRNPLSSPALSLDRLEIRCRNGRRLIVSPRDKDGFTRALGVTPG